MYRPHIFAACHEMIAAQSMRQLELSTNNSDQLNLGLYSDDSPALVRENRQRFAHQLGLSADQFAGAHQVHGSEVAIVAQPGELEGYDALITNKPNVILTITTADCLPVLLYDPVNKACGAAHAGWRGTVAKIVQKTLKAMQKNFGTSPKDCLAYIGPGISYEHFEVGEEVARLFPEQFVRTGVKAGKFHADMKAYNLAQLLDSGLLKHHIEVSPDCTVQHNDRYFSYRKEQGITGRMLAVIGTLRTFPI